MISFVLVDFQHIFDKTFTSEKTVNMRGILHNKNVNELLLRREVMNIRDL
jgi:hypothetical protein